MNVFFKSKHFLLFIVVYVFFVLKLYYGHHINVADDVWFANVYNSEPNIFSWLKKRYFQWTSRVPIEFALIMLITHFKMWVGINSLMFSLLFVSVFKFLELSIQKFFIAIIVMFFLIAWGIPKNVFFEAVIWMTGSFNYLWPVAIATMGFLLLYKENTQKKIGYFSIGSFVLIFLSSFNEQMAVVNMIAVVVTIAFLITSSKKKIGHLFFLFFLIILAMIIIVTCPGNMARYHLETLSWFKGFDNINLLGKFVLGCNLYFNSLMSEYSIVPFFSLLAAAKICEKKWAKLVLFAWAAILFLMLFLHPAQIYLDENNVLALKPIMISLLMVLYLGSIVFSISLSRDFDQYSAIAIICFIASAASVVFLGLSPTIYASGKRVLFISYVVMIFFIMIGFFKKNSSGCAKTAG